ncbi:ferredoxin [Streptomyces sp. MAR4 CNX-425]|uniref:ferredoxin n=1 Tax=Streptomyces sp. MAR4 CNX-425 TaxID=3406343 RepID=UPI003B514ED0
MPADSTWLVAVDRTVCLGTGVCASVFPQHFVITEGKSRPRAGESLPHEELLDAVDLCPMGAITVTDRATGTAVVPDD